MNSFIAKYVLLFFITVITTDTFLFFYSNKEKDKEVHDIKILSKAIEKSLEKEDLTTVNDVLDSFEEKVIIQRDGVIYTSNFGYDSEERRDFATTQLQTYRPFWRNVDVPSEKYSQLLYYKTKEIQYFDRIINNTIYSFSISLLSFPILILALLEIKKRKKEEEKLKYYLQTIRENMEQVKDNEVIEKYESEKYDKLKTKLEESKNRRLALKQELENKTLEFDKLKPEISKLKSEIQSLKIEKNKMEDLFKNSFAKEKNDLILKIASLKEQIKIKEDFIDKNNLKVSDLEEKISRNKEKILTKDKEINLLKISKVASEEFKEQTIRIQTLEKEVFKKNTEVRELLNQLELKNERINNLKEESSTINIEKLRLDNQVNTMSIKKDTDKDVIEALINENNSYKDKIFSLTDKLKEMDTFFNKDRDSDSGDISDSSKLMDIIKAKDLLIKKITEDKTQKDNELKEFTLDTIDKLSALKRYEIQIADISKELLKKNNLIDSLNTRIDSKDKLINALIKEMNEIKEKIQDGNFNIINELIKD